MNSTLSQKAKLVGAYGALSLIGTHIQDALEAERIHYRKLSEQEKRSPEGNLSKVRLDNLVKLNEDYGSVMDDMENAVKLWIKI